MSRFGQNDPTLIQYEADNTIIFTRKNRSPPVTEIYQEEIWSSGEFSGPQLVFRPLKESFERQDEETSKLSSHTPSPLVSSDRGKSAKLSKREISPNVTHSHYEGSPSRKQSSSCSSETQFQRFITNMWGERESVLRQVVFTQFSHLEH